MLSTRASCCEHSGPAVITSRQCSDTICTCHAKLYQLQHGLAGDIQYVCAEADAEERAKALNMMRMLANRQNSRWLEAKEWDAPYTFDATNFPTLLGDTPYTLLTRMCCLEHKTARLLRKLLPTEAGLCQCCVAKSSCAL